MLPSRWSKSYTVQCHGQFPPPFDKEASQIAAFLLHFYALRAFVKVGYFRFGDYYRPIL